ncbi:MAG: SprT family zinc-dependent metalloprotease [Pseudomonadota bacterium]
MQQIAFEFKNPPFHYELVRSRRKTLVIYVKSGDVEVRAPLRASEKWINEFLTEKTPWVQSQLATQRKKQKQQLVLAEGVQLTLKGEPVTLHIALSKKRPHALHAAGKLTLFVKEHTKTAIEKLFLDWLLEQAKSYMPTLAKQYARAIGLEHKLGKVTFRKTRTKWGHCCEDGDIQFNWLLMLAPKPVLDYLIAHETSHLRHLNHSMKFWNTVGELCPDYKKHRDWLTDNGHRLWLS